jgi:hypothetical protein
VDGRAVDGGPERLVDRLSRTLAEVRRTPAAKTGGGADGGTGAAADVGAGAAAVLPEGSESDLMDRLLAELLRGAPAVPPTTERTGEARPGVAADARVPDPRPDGPRQGR